MWTKWNQGRARAVLDECNQDLYEARLRLEGLRVSFGAISDQVAAADAQVKDFEGELEGLLQDWKKHTPRQYRPKYPADWRIIAEQAKDGADWTCQQCHARLGQPDHRRLLHVHHINRVAKDNCALNLQVLCAMCHSIQPDHYGIRVSDKDIAVITRQRLTDDCCHERL